MLSLLNAPLGHWRTHRLPGQLRVLRYQRRRGGRPLPLWIGRPLFPGRARDSREGLPGLRLTLHAEGKKVISDILIQLLLHF